MNTLIVGGARSGKSAYAEQLARQIGQPVTVIATAHAGDGEMAWRIAQHRARRPDDWQTIEEPVALGRVLDLHGLQRHTVVIDCLTLWLSNLMTADGVAPVDGAFEEPSAFASQRELLLNSLQRRDGDTILVSNEIGCGVVPLGAANRWFVDEMGRLNQALAQCCERVVLVAAGLPLHLKG